MANEGTTVVRSNELCITPNKEITLYFERLQKSRDEAWNATTNCQDST